MKVLNRQYRGMDKTTDVLSFPQTSAIAIHELQTADHEFVLGDIAINLHKAKRQSAENGISFNEEINRLLIHGLLHLVGYDHEQSAYLSRKMEKKEMELLGSTK